MKDHGHQAVFMVAPVVFLAVLTVTVLTACADDCDKAADLCEECELKTESCKTRFAQASAEYCADAVAVYEASCPEK